MIRIRCAIQSLIEISGCTRIPTSYPGSFLRSLPSEQERNVREKRHRETSERNVREKRQRETSERNVIEERQGDTSERNVREIRQRETSERYVREKRHRGTSGRYVREKRQTLNLAFRISAVHQPFYILISISTLSTQHTTFITLFTSLFILR